MLSRAVVFVVCAAVVVHISGTGIGVSHDIAVFWDQTVLEWLFVLVLLLVFLMMMSIFLFFRLLTLTTFTAVASGAIIEV